MLNQCVNVLQGLSEFVKSEPELQARLKRLGLLSKDEDRRRPRQDMTSLKEEPDKENAVPTRLSAFTPIGSHRRGPTASTSTPFSEVSPPSHFPSDHSTLGRRKWRESVDSGLPSLSSSSSLIPSTPSTSSDFGVADSQPRKRLRDSSSGIWRPYRD